MELDHKKNLTASLYVDNTKIIDADNSMVYGKFEEKDDTIYVYIKSSNGRSAKMVFKKYAEEHTDEDI